MGQLEGEGPNNSPNAGNGARKEDNQEDKQSQDLSQDEPAINENSGELSANDSIHSNHNLHQDGVSSSKTNSTPTNSYMSAQSSEETPAIDSLSEAIASSSDQRVESPSDEGRISSPLPEAFSNQSSSPDASRHVMAAPSSKPQMTNHVMGSEQTAITGTLAMTNHEAVSEASVCPLHDQTNTISPINTDDSSDLPCSQTSLASSSSSDLDVTEMIDQPRQFQEPSSGHHQTSNYARSLSVTSQRSNRTQKGRLSPCLETESLEMADMISDERTMTSDDRGEREKQTASEQKEESRLSTEQSQQFDEVSLGEDIREEILNNNNIDMPDYNTSNGQVKSINDKIWTIGKNKYQPNKDDDKEKNKKEKKKNKKEEKKKENEEEVAAVPFHRLFRYSTLKERLLIAVGILAAIAGGCSVPIMIILFGELANSFVSQAQSSANSTNATFPGCIDDSGEFNLALPSCEFDPDSFETDKDIFYREITKFAQGSAIIGLVNLVTGYLFVTCLNYAAECQVFRIRILFLRAVLRQNIGWYDVRQNGDFASKITEDLNKLQEGIGEKIGIFIFFMTIFIASLTNAFIHGWELTLVILGAMPVLIIAITILAGCQAALTKKELNAYSKAGCIAEEALSAVRTVVAFGGEGKEVERYGSKLVHARRAGIIRGSLTAIGAGVMWFIIYSSYALAFWYGVKLIMDDRDACDEDPSDCNPRYTPSSLLIVFFSVLMGAMNLGQASPYVEAFSMAKGSAATIFGILDRKPPIDSSSKGGIIPEKLHGDITFRNTKFNYPARKDVPILKGLDLTISAGQTVALVGPSGCGKSTVIQLIQRFYDPDNGSIHLDSSDLRDLNIGWLRDQIGVVGQEPVLFGTSIEENIRFGREGVTEEEITKACKEANAYGFIQKLPKKLDTLVGDKGAQLSGGQKQRIAIARALVRNPKILLLDEATSALDSASEACVQVALDRAKTGRTTIIVAHRLSTVRSADKIIAIRDGQVVEEGSHHTLMLARGLYHSLVTTQMNRAEDDEDLEVEEDDIMETNPVPNLDHLLTDDNSSSQPTSLLSMSSLTGPFGRKKTVERKISVMSNYSTYSEDSLGFENAIEVATSAVGIARVGSTRTSQHMSQRRSVVRLDSEPIGATLASGSGLPEYEEELVKVDPVRIMKMQLEDWPYILFGILGSIVMGAAMPVYAILFGEVLGILRLPSDQAREECIYYCGLFVATGITAGIAIFMQIFMFSIAGEHLTQRMRRLAFAAMLRQEMGWFDRPENSVGALLSRLSGDASAIQGATGSRIGAILHAAFTLIISITTSLVLEWRLGLVGCLFVPLVLVGTIMQFKVISGQDTAENSSLQKASKLAVEAINNIRTVAGLRKEDYFIREYESELIGPHVSARLKAHVRGILFGFSQSVPFFAYSGCMFYGGYLVYSEDFHYKKVFKVAEALILGTMMVGQASAFAPNYTKAMIAAARVFNLIDRKPAIDSSAGSGLRLNQVDGEIEFRNAVFSYPNRRQVRVLKNLNLCVQSGTSVALVGASGSGKSTCVQLLQRLYDLNSGDITLENHDLGALNVPWVRSKLSIVSQEPVLFNRSLAENIAYGDNSKEVSMEEVIAAARKANIHQFITNLPQGYETNVGDKGTQLSGGQKQRIAIARALIRNPPVLLLDEATSALDTESERLVQSALDSAQRGRTTMTIAHRLATVRNCSTIFVLHHGRLVESGSHDELLRMRGAYYKLWSTQTGGTDTGSGANIHGIAASGTAARRRERKTGRNIV